MSIYFSIIFFPHTFFSTSLVIILIYEFKNN